MDKEKGERERGRRGRQAGWGWGIKEGVISPGVGVRWGACLCLVFWGFGLVSAGAVVGKGGTLFSVFSSAPKPFILICQQRVQDFSEFDPNMDVMRALAQTMGETGRAVPVLWSAFDAVTSAAMKELGWETLPDKPSEAQLWRMAGTIKAQYLILCRAHLVTGLGSPQKGQGSQESPVQARIELYSVSARRLLWSEDSTLVVFREGKVDQEATALALAGSWTAKMFSGPLKDAGGGERTVGPPTAPAVPYAPPRSLAVEPLESGKQALQEGLLEEAIDLLRDAVDADPLNLEARLALVEAFRRSGRFFLAVDEALRAYKLLPGETRLLLAGAQCLSEGGKLDRALELVREVLSKDKDHAGAYALLGDLLVGNLDFSGAISAYTRALEISPEPETFFRRAQAYALAEKFDLSMADLSEAQKRGLSEEPEAVRVRYERTVLVVSTIFQSFGTEIRNLLAEAKTEPNNATLRGRVEALITRLNAFSRYWSAIDPPEKHRNSHERRALACNLLIQSAWALDRFLKHQEPVSHSDAFLLQIEAMRELAGAQEAYQAERRQPT